MIKLIYFDFNFWRIDILRLSLSHSDIPYKFESLARNEWPKNKKKFPFGQLPVMVLNKNGIFSYTFVGKILCKKSNAI